MNPLKAISQKMELIGLELTDNIQTLNINPNPDTKTRSKLIEPLREAKNKMTDLAYKFLEDFPYNGNEAKKLFSIKTDILIKEIFSTVTEKFYPLASPTRGENLALLALGGYGRGEMAPYSDIDLLFISPFQQTSWTENVTESILYILWDLKFKVGHSSRTINDCLQLGLIDLTIRTSLLEKRFLCGNKIIYDELDSLLWNKLFRKTATGFLEGKLKERDERHIKHANSRYLLEPNIKESKGGLRDLQTLYWIAKYIYQTDKISNLIKKNIFTRKEIQIFTDAENFIWFVRCKMHQLSGYANEKLHFNIQVELAKNLKIEDYKSRKGVEIFMQKYFIHAKNVGDLTRIFLTAMEENLLKTKPKYKLKIGKLLGIGSSKKPFGKGFIVENGRLNIRDKDLFKENPLNILNLFVNALSSQRLIHPDALRAVALNLNLIDENFRNNVDANDIFLNLLISFGNPERVLRRMNEVGFLGTFIPQFGRIVGLMQFNMYHSFTVDEHTIQCISILSNLEKNAQEFGTVSSRIFQNTKINRKIIYLALLFHDIGKGLENDHSIEGEKIVTDLNQRFSLSIKEKKKIAWLVRNHLVMSDYAQKRDLSDSKTIKDFSKKVMDKEHLDLLYILTICDIRGVSPEAWNSWKSSLLESLYFQTLEIVHQEKNIETKKQKISKAQVSLRTELKGLREHTIKQELSRHFEAYWLVLDQETHLIVAKMIRKLGKEHLQIELTNDEKRKLTKIIFVMEDHPGIFSRLAGSLAISSSSVVDAKTFTSRDGIAIFVFWIKDAYGDTYDKSKMKKLLETVKSSLTGKFVTKSILEKRDKITEREREFKVPTNVLFDNDGSQYQTIIEVDTRDRVGLLFDLTNTLFRNQVTIRSAVIATYGEQAVDTFYVNDLFGDKILSNSKLEKLEKELLLSVEKNYEKAIKN